MNLEHSPQRLAALEKFLTTERLSYFLDESDGELADAIRLYELNTQLSATLYGPVQGMEVLLRNAMNKQLVIRFGPDWHDLTNIILDHRQERDVQKAERDIDGDVTNGAMVAGLSLGFWAGLLNTSNDNEVWRKALHLAFPHRPKGTERKQIHGTVNAVRRLRNRIAHHEKILHRNLVEDHDRILEVASWICPETRGWIADMSSFDKTKLPSYIGEELPLEPPSERNEPKETLNGRPRLSLG